MQFFEVVEYVGRQLGLSGLVPTPAGTCALRLDAVVLVFVHDAAAAALDLSARLGHVDIQSADLLEELLAANRAADGGGASALACDAAGTVTLRQRFALQALSLPRFMGDMTRFVGRAEHWQARLAARATA